MLPREPAPVQSKSSRSSPTGWCPAVLSRRNRRVASGGGFGFAPASGQRMLRDAAGLALRRRSLLRQSSAPSAQEAHQQDARRLWDLVRKGSRAVWRVSLLCGAVSHGLSAIHRQRDSVDVAREIGREEHGRSGDFLWLSQAAGGDARHEAAQALRSHCASIRSSRSRSRRARSRSTRSRHCRGRRPSTA